MFYKKEKQIQILKSNLQKLNENRKELAAENRAYQQSLHMLNDKYDKLITAFREQNKVIVELLEKSNIKEPVTTKDVDKKQTNKKVSNIPKKGTREYKVLERETREWFNTNYKSLMKKTKQTQVSIAKTLNVSTSSIWGIDKNIKKRTPSLELRLRVKNLLLSLNEDIVYDRK